MTKEDLSLEKLKIHERLQALELSNARIVSHLESEQGTFARYTDSIHKNIDRLEAMLKRHDELLIGPQGEGLVMIIDRLSQKDRTREWHVKALWTSSLGFIVKTIYDLINKMK